MAYKPRYQFFIHIYLSESKNQGSIKAFKFVIDTTLDPTKSKQRTKFTHPK